MIYSIQLQGLYTVRHIYAEPARNVHLLIPIHYSHSIR